MTQKHLITLPDLTPAELLEILDTADRLKAAIRAGIRQPLLQGRVLAQLFEKPSLRTRNSFEAAMIQLGGGGVFLSIADAGLNGRELMSDVAHVLSSYSDVITMRTFSHQLIKDFSQHCTCPVINALSDERHPCQALTDLMTIRETFGRLKGLRLAFVGDGNNVSASLAFAAGMTGLSLVIAAPEGYQLGHTFLESVRSRFPGADVSETLDPRIAVKDADVIYTDVWASMGQEAEAEERHEAFAGFQVNAELMAQAPKTARFMHDLPAKRGLEVTNEVMDGPQSIVFQQAENRMHLARGLFAWLLAD